MAWFEELARSLGDRSLSPFQELAQVRCCILLHSPRKLAPQILCLRKFAALTITSRAHDSQNQ